MNKENLTAYEVVTEENLTDIHSTGWLLRHKKTGARVMLIENDDENKVFNIAFRTPPKDSTGVAHILEHSVLCGSREFPLKDPFVELVKGSLNTFLNAMTYPDNQNATDNAHPGMPVSLPYPYFHTDKYSCWMDGNKFCGNSGNSHR